MTPPLDIAPGVAAALAGGQPVVALESTILTHGMPWPQNLDMARRVETVIREGGAVPATIAVIEGRIRVGLDALTLESLAQMRDAAVMKLSRADLASCLALGRIGIDGYHPRWCGGREQGQGRHADAAAADHGDAVFGR